MKTNQIIGNDTYIPELKFTTSQDTIFTNQKDKYDTFSIVKIGAQDGNHFIIYGNTPKNKKDIQSESKTLYNALRLAFIRCHIAINMNIDISNLESVGSYTHSEIAYNAISGLETSPKVIKDFSLIARNIDFFYHKSISINKNQNAVIDMLTTTFYEKSIWVKFFICMASIEILIKENRKNKQGIRKRCSNYIKKHLGEKYSVIFEKLYKIRCKFAHGKFNTAPKDIPSEQAYNLVEKILYHQLGIKDDVE